MICSRQAKHKIVQCPFYRWVLKRRGRVWYADGRGNRPELGRHSLGTCDQQAALERLEHLDHVKAVEHGRAEDTPVQGGQANVLSLDDGITAYFDYLSRPAVTGGVSPKTRQRYQAVFDKFAAFSKRRGVTDWQGVTTPLVRSYLASLERGKYGAATLYLEGTVLTQFVKWARDAGLLPPEARVALTLRKVQQTGTYCYRSEEVEAMIAHCRGDSKRHWLADVVVLLSRTGLRIGEATQLRVADIDLERGILHVRNDPAAATRRGVSPRQTKNREDRSIPIHPDLREVLRRLPHRSDGRVFHGPRGGALKADTVRSIFVKDVITPLANRFSSAGDEIGFKDGRLHSFRHFFCSCCANEGVPQQMAMRWLGHKDSRMMQRYYHLHDAEARREMGSLSFAGRPDGKGVVDASPDS